MPTGKVSMKTIRLFIIFALLLLAIALAWGQGSKSGYRVVEKVKIGGDGGWDYSIVDTTAHRLYLSHATRVIVFDTDSKTVVDEIPNTIGVHGIALAPELGRGYTSNGRDSSVSVYVQRRQRQCYRSECRNI